MTSFTRSLIRYTQDALAAIQARGLTGGCIDGAIVRARADGRGFCVFAWLSCCGFLQVGNLQAYAFFFGIGVVLLVYLAIL